MSSRQQTRPNITEFLNERITHEENVMSSMMLSDDFGHQPQNMIPRLESMRYRLRHIREWLVAYTTILEGPHASPSRHLNIQRAHQWFRNNNIWQSHSQMIHQQQRQITDLSGRLQLLEQTVPSLLEYLRSLSPPPSAPRGA